MKTRRFIVCCRVALLVVLLTAPTVAGAIDDIFVRVAGIAGESTARDHEGWIDVSALGNGVTTTVTGPGGGGGGTDTTFSDLSILKRIDRASPLLFLAAARAQQFSMVEVDFVRRGQDPFTYFKMKLMDVLITGVRTNASVTEDAITEFVTFKFGRIEWEYKVQNPDGSAGDVVRGCWNVATHAVCT
jgi:type VI secretion system secreted protein Hcp